MKNGYAPDLVLCSPSRRTRQTWHSVAVALARVASPLVRYQREIYDGSVSDLLKAVQASGPEQQTIILIGHNPTISQLSEVFDPGGADSDGLRTCGIAVHEAPGDWVSIETAARIAVHTARAD